MSQTSLVDLNLENSQLSSEETVQVLTWMCQSSNLTTLKELEMCDAFNFELDEACTLLAQLIDTTTILEYFNIG